MIKLELTWHSGLRPAICSGCGIEAAASPFAPARFAIQFDSVEVGNAIGGAPPLNDEPDSKAKRCSIGCIGAEERSKPPSEPPPLPSPISSIGGITARGMPDSVDAGALAARAH